MNNDEPLLPDTDGQVAGWNTFLRAHVYVRVHTEEPRNSAFQGICGFYTFLREMPYCQYIELKEKASRDLEFMLL